MSQDQKCGEPAEQNCCITLKRRLQHITGSELQHAPSYRLRVPRDLISPIGLLRGHRWLLWGQANSQGDRLLTHRRFGARRPEQPPETPNRQAAAPGEIRVRGGWRIGMHSHLFGVQRVVVGRRSPAAAPLIPEFAVLRVCWSGKASSERKGLVLITRHSVSSHNL